MKNVLLKIAPALLLVACASTESDAKSEASGSKKAYASTEAPAWHMNATIIEACSCPMFCQCYFNSKPAGPGCCSKPDDPLLKTRFCRFNNAFKVNSGTHNGTKLDGAKFWVAGDLGAEFDDGEMDWAVLHFDPSVTKEQRTGITTALGKLYPVKWKSFVIGADAPIEWTATKEHATAKLDGGKGGEVQLASSVNHNAAGPTVIQNLKYFGAPRNDGFVLMPNEIEAYRLTDKAFEYKGTNGFMITVDIASKD
jgi:hypothetical protein